MTRLVIPSVPGWALSTDFPLMLLPIRLETRYFGAELRIRIFPDDIHIDSHEPALTDTEIGDAKTYWTTVADDDAQAAETAWTWLTESYGAPRASWIARVMEPVDGLFPTNPSERPTAWGRAPRASALPTRWHAVGVSGEHVAAFGSSKPIPAELSVGPAPEADLSEVPADQVPLDQDSRWLIDYQEAVANGMALSLSLPAAVAASGLDQLIVFGVDETADPVDSAALLDDLFEAQASTAGLCYLPPHTSTNLTENPQEVSDRDIAAAQVGLGEQAPAGPDTNATRLAEALGIATTTAPGGLLNRTRGTPPSRGAPTAVGRANAATLGEETGARAAADALWGATWGYFLPALTGSAADASTAAAGPGTGGAVLNRIRQLYTNFVRPGGPLPTVRVGRQPYGILPVLALDDWADREGDPAYGAGAMLLRRLRDQVWHPSVAHVPVIRPGLTDPGAALLQVLGMGESSTQLNVRTLLGNDYVTHLWRFSRLKLDDGWEETRALGLSETMRNLGLTDFDMPIARAIFSGSVYELGGPLVSAADDAAYFSILTGSAVTIRDQPELPTGPTPLLYRMLRHAALTEYDAAARKVAARHALLHPDDVPEPELIDLEPGSQTQTMWRRLARTFTGANGTPTSIANYLAGDTGTDPDAAHLRRFRSALGILSELPVADLERHLVGAIDLASYRLDAWLTAYATRRLDWLRRKQCRGVHIGGYGWLTEVRPRAAAPTVAPPPNETGPVHAAPAGAGHVHAPSLPQANTAAVLRSGFRNHQDPGAAANPYAVDVSSRRLRIARQLLDGVRQGQSLGALLGYRFERGLHDAGRMLDRYLPRLRELAPVLATRINADGTTREVIATTATIDGLALHRRRGEINWRTDPRLPSPPSPDHEAIQSLLDDLDEAVDALADALVAESVHHAVQGNPLRAGASLDAASRGNAPPPDLEFVRTPRTGIGVTHRVLLLTNPGTVDRTVWPIDGWQVRAHADPYADSLAAALLPAPSRARARVLWSAPDPEPSSGDESPDDEPATVETHLTLDALQLSALDHVFMPGGDQLAEDTELVQRIVLSARTAARPQGVGADWVVHVNVDRDPDWAPDVLSVQEFATASAAVRRLLDAGHQLSASDLITPDQAAADSPPDDSLVAQAATAIEAAAAVAAALDSSDGPQLRDGLTRAAGFGIVGALPPPPGPHAEPEMLAAAVPVQRELHRRLQAADAVRDDPVSVLRALFGADFPALAAHVATEELRSSFAASDDLQDGDTASARDWLTRYARVRTGADRLHETLSNTDVLGTAGPAAGSTVLSVAQLPYASGDRWLGLPHRPAAPDGPRLSFVIGAPHPVNLAAPVVGIAVDEWTEVIPNATEMTGVTFEYDAPGAVAPQTILLAVPADAAKSWTAPAVLGTLAEAFDLARIRAVDPDSLNDLGQFLPALYFPVNVDPQQGATDFTLSAAVNLAKK